MSKLVKGDQVVVDNIFMLYRSVTEPQNLILDDASDGDTDSEDSLDRAQQQADRIINQAVAFQEQTMKEAEQAAKKAYEDAMQSGYKNGYADGFKVAEEKNKSLVNELEALIKQLDASRESLLEESRENMLMLACDIARKVIDKQLDCEDEAYVNIYKKAVRDLYGKKHIRLTVSKHEISFATSSTDYLLSLVKGAERLELELLEDAERGTCIIETDDEIIDASVQKQADIIEQALLEL